MADPLSVTAPVLAVITAAVQSTRSLIATIQRFKGRDKTLRRLQDEVEDLGNILGALREVANLDVAISTLLERPMDRCSQVCQDFENAMKEFSGKANDSLLYWAKMEFRRGDINEFLDTLETYKSTISVGLAAINMHTSKLSQKALEEYNEMIQNTAYGLTIQLKRIDEKMTRFTTGSHNVPDHSSSPPHTINAMTEPIGLASGLVALVDVAFKSSLALYNTIQSIRFQPKRARDLTGELEALQVVLRMLTETLNHATDTDLSVLETPLRRCSDVCNEFEEELLRCCSRSGGDRTSFRGWAKLTYMGDGIDSVRQLLAGYKSIINIALTDATLRTSFITTQTLENHQQLIKTATDDFESHLQDINKKVDALLKRAVTETDSNEVELRRLKDERESTEKGFELCRQLSAHIYQIQVKQTEEYSAGPGLVATEQLPERIINAGLNDCKGNLNLKVRQLEWHLQTIMARSRISSKDLVTRDDKTELTRLLDESETVRQCISICAEADARIQKNLSSLTADCSNVTLQVSHSLPSSNVGLSSEAKFVIQHIIEVDRTGHSVVYVDKKDPQQVVKAEAIWIEGKPYGPASQPKNTSYHLQREYAIYQALGEHPLITACYGLDMDEQGEARALRLEYAERGDLRRYITKNHAPLMGRRLRIAAEFADGVQYLHSRGVVWCDLSTRNALLFGDSQLKLCDFAGSTLKEVYPTPSCFAYELRYFPALPDEECPALGSMAFELSALGTAICEITEWTIPYTAEASLNAVDMKLAARERPVVSDDNPARDLIFRCWDFECSSAQEVADTLRQIQGALGSSML